MRGGGGFQFASSSGLPSCPHARHLFVPSRLSNRARHARIADALAKRVDSLLIAALELRTVVRVEINEIDFARNVASDFDETIRVLVAVVHAFEHDVLEKYLSLVPTERLARKLATEQSKKHFEVVLAIDGHDPVANVIRRGVERHGQRRLTLA